MGGESKGLELKQDCFNSNLNETSNMEQHSSLQKDSKIASYKPPSKKQQMSFGAGQDSDTSYSSFKVQMKQTKGFKRQNHDSNYAKNAQI